MTLFTSYRPGGHNPSSKTLNVHHLASSVYFSHPPSTQGVSQRNSFVYILWNEPQSEEPPGGYLAKVTYISDNGNAVIHYKRLLKKLSTCSMSHGLKQRVMGSGSFQFHQPLRLWEPPPQNPQNEVHIVRKALPMTSPSFLSMNMITLQSFPLSPKSVLTSIKRFVLTNVYQ